MSWLESISRGVIWVGSSEKVTPSQIEWDKPKKSHTKSNSMEQRPIGNGIMESRVDSNEYSRTFFESWVIWIEILEIHLGDVCRFESNSRTPFRVVSWFKSILESHCESWIESESKLSDNELNRIEKMSRTHVLDWEVYRKIPYDVDLGVIDDVTGQV